MNDLFAPKYISQSETNKKGDQGENAFANFCKDNNIIVAAPSVDCWRFDFLIELNKTVLRINVKTMFKGKRENCYNVDIQTSKGVGKKRAYTEGEIDYFAVVNVDEKEQPIWLLPLDSTKGKQTLYWYPPDKPHRKRVDSFNWEPYHIYSHDLGVNQNNLVKVR